MQFLRALFGARRSEERNAPVEPVHQKPMGVSPASTLVPDVEETTGLLCTTAEPSTNDRVRWIAAMFGSDDVEFRRRAASAAGHLGASRINELAALYHAEHTPPAGLNPRFHALGAWMTARQFAIFEVFYCFGGEALPVLRAVMFGQYDWIQGNAIEVLCRLAADGVERAEIIDDLIGHLPSMREEALQYAIGPLLHQQRSNPQLGEVISALRSVPEFDQWCRQLES